MKRAMDLSEARRETDADRLHEKNNATASIKEGGLPHSQMQREELQHRETLLLEVLLSGLDSRESAREARSSMLGYLAELLVTRAREELEQVRTEIDKLETDAASNDKPA